MTEQAIHYIQTKTFGGVCCVTACEQEMQVDETTTEDLDTVTCPECQEKMAIKPVPAPKKKKRTKEKAPGFEPPVYFVTEDEKLMFVAGEWYRATKHNDELCACEGCAFRRVKNGRTSCGLKEILGVGGKGMCTSTARKDKTLVVWEKTHTPEQAIAVDSETCYYDGNWYTFKAKSTCDCNDCAFRNKDFNNTCEQLSRCANVNGFWLLADYQPEGYEQDETHIHHEGTWYKANREGNVSCDKCVFFNSNKPWKQQCALKDDGLNPLCSINDRKDKHTINWQVDKDREGAAEIESPAEELYDYTHNGKEYTITTEVTCAGCAFYKTKPPNYTVTCYKPSDCKAECSSAKRHDGKSIIFKKKANRKKPKKRWKPKDGNQYWTVSLVRNKEWQHSPDILCWNGDEGDPFDNSTWEMGLCFKTKEEAEAACKRLDLVFKEEVRSIKRDQAIKLREE